MNHWTATYSHSCINITNIVPVVAEFGFSAINTTVLFKADGTLALVKVMVQVVLCCS